MYGIIGYPLSQSFSPAYFNHKFMQLGIDERYQAFPIGTIEALPSLLHTYPGLKGFNVTMPYKQEVMAYLDELDHTAAAIGAVNTVRIRTGRLKGFNTDAAGFMNSLKPLLQPQHRAALVLGTGGASKAVTYSLRQLGIPYRLVSRRQTATNLGYADLGPALMQQHLLIINTTPLGMTPDTGSFPDIPYELLTEAHLVYDLIYKPEKTLFLQKAKEQGAAVKNGYDMLIGQAEAAWAIWTQEE